MRARSIKPGICDNELLGTADPYYTLLFERLWMIADREGRLEDRPLRIKAQAFPYRDGLDVGPMLAWLVEHGFIVRYEVDGKKFIQITNFARHQSPHKNEQPSVLPAPTEGSTTKAVPSSATGAVPEHNQGSAMDALTPDSGLLTPDSGLRDTRARPVDFEKRIQAAYPRGPAVSGSAWGVGIRNACRAVDDGLAKADELLDAVGRYAASIESRVALEGERARQFVKSPAKFFDLNARPPVWRDEFPLAVSKAQAAQDDNIAAGMRWLQEGRA